MRTPLPEHSPLRKVLRRWPGYLAGPVLLLAAVLLSGACNRQQTDTQALKDKIRNVLQLETAEFVYRDLVYRSLGSTVMGITTRDTRVLAEVKLRVIAGIDIRQGLELTVVEDTKNGTRLEVRIPHARILVVDADESSIKQFMLQEYGFMTDGRISLLEFSDQLAENKKAITADALERGILDRAETNARQVITNLLSLAGYPQVNIGFLEGPVPVPTLPSSTEVPAHD